MKNRFTLELDKLDFTSNNFSNNIELNINQHYNNTKNKNFV